MGLTTLCGPEKKTVLHGIVSVASVPAKVIMIELAHVVTLALVGVTEMRKAASAKTIPK